MIFILLCTKAWGFEKSNLILKINSIETLTFKFEQTIEEKTETGSCLLKYPLLINCSYNDSLKKNLISNGKTLAVIQRRYKKIFYYKLKKTPLNFLLDKNSIISYIHQNEPIFSNDNATFKISDKKNNQLIIKFDKENLNLKGWETIDSYGKKVNFEIFDIKKNEKIDKEKFKVPREEDL